MCSVCETGLSVVSAVPFLVGNASHEMGRNTDQMGTKNGDIKVDKMSEEGYEPYIDLSAPRHTARLHALQVQLPQGRIGTHLAAGGG
jgi:hypothetical protein